MSLTLHFGVVDIPYKHTEKVSERRKRIKAALKSKERDESQGTTTGEVAEILEEKYHIMRIFVETHEKQIEEALVKSLEGQLENLAVGVPVNLSNGFAEGAGDLEEAFKQFLSNSEIEKVGFPGVPTKAALKGVSHRFKHPYAKHPRRPSFIDTGTYQASMKVWVD